MRKPAEELAATWGLGPFNPQELQDIYEWLCQQITICLQRRGSPTQADGGLPAIHTGVPPMSLDEWKGIAQGSEAIVCALGNTNLVVSHAVKKKGHASISVKELSRQLVATGDYNIERFVRLMASSIVEVSHQYQLEHISALGVSLGFPHINECTPYGVEGILSSDDLVKHWVEAPEEIEDRRMGKVLMEHLVQRGGPQIEQVAFLNDACAIALDIGSAWSNLSKETELLPIGMVCGTGTNECLGYQGEMVNLEIGDAICDADLIMEEMMARDAFSHPPLLEYYTGMFIPYRVGTVLELLGERGLVPQGKALGQELRQSDGAILSQLAGGKVSVDDVDDWGWDVSVTPEDLRLLQELARQALSKAGQVYGAILAAGIYHARRASTKPIRKGVVLAGGAVINKGHQVREAIRNTCEQLGQRQVYIAHSSGLAGIGAFVMKQSSINR